MRIVAAMGIVLLVGGLASAQGIGIDVPEVGVDPIVDGAASFATEWTSAVVAPDSFVDPFTGVTPAGFFYYQKRTGWTATSSSGGVLTYPGTTLFIAHDIFGAPTGSFASFRTNDAADWNYVKATRPSGAVVECWCFGGFSTSPTPPHVPPTDVNELDDGLWLAGAVGLGASILVPEGPGTDLIDDRGFIVRLNGDPTTDRHWFPGMPEPGDAGWAWEDWYGCFARAGFNSTFFDTGTDPDAGHAPRNEAYEWAFHGTVTLEPPLDCTEWKIEWVDPPKYAIIYIAPNWFIHFGFPPVPALPWPWVLALGLLLALGGWLVFAQRAARALALVALAGGALLLAGCGGGGGRPPISDKVPPPFELPPLVPHNAYGGQLYPVSTVAGPRPPLMVPVVGGTPPYMCTLVTGQLPPGINLSPDGMISSGGNPVPNPSDPRTYDFEYQVVDATGAMMRGHSSMHIDPDPFQVPIELVSLSLTGIGPTLEGRVGQEMFGAVYVRGGDPSQPYQFQVSPTSRNPLPNGLNLSPSGILRGTPSQPTGGPMDVEILVMNGGTQQAMDVFFDIML